MSLPLGYTLLAAYTLALTYAGYRLTPLLFPTLPRDFLTRLTLGSAFSLALTLLLTSYAAHLDYRYVYPALAFYPLAAFIYRPPTGEPLSPHDRPYLRAITALLALALLIRLVITTRWILPRGWDPSFHLLLASRIEETHALIRDWRPYENIPLHYPVFPHALLAATSTATTLPLERIFSTFEALLSILLSATVFTLARAWKLPLSTALTATGIFTFTVKLGSLGYLDWGGLPNLLGMTLLLAALTIISTEYTPTQTGLATSVASAFHRALPLALLGAALLLSHHHICFTAALLILPTALLFRRNTLPAIALAIPLAWPLFLALLPRITALRDTTITSAEDLPTLLPFAHELGWGYFALLTLLLIRLALTKRLGPLPLPRHPIPYLTTGILLTLYTLGLFGCHALSYLLNREPFTFLTPSRFLTDATPFLAIFAAIPLTSLFRNPTPPKLLTAITFLSLPTLPHYLPLRETLPFDGRYLTATTWIRNNTKPNTLILNGRNHPEALSQWLSYLTRRQTTLTPIPISEPSALIAASEPRLTPTRPLLNLNPNKWLRPEVDLPLFSTGQSPTDITVFTHTGPPTPLSNTAETRR